MKTSVSIDVAKETHELGQGLRHFISQVRTALVDGWQPGTDLPTVMQAAFTDLLPHIQDADKISKEPVENKKAFVKALNNAFLDIAFDFVGE